MEAIARAINMLACMHMYLMPMHFFLIKMRREHTLFPPLPACMFAARFTFYKDAGLIIQQEGKEQQCEINTLRFSS